MNIHVTAPNRVDLAGGTTDLYPLFLLLEGGCTVNLAIGVYSSVTLATRRKRGIRIVSEDLGETLEASGPETLPTHGPLGLAARAVKVCAPDTGLEIVTRNDAPAGSGLGASSALLIALLKGLLRLGNRKTSGRAVIELAMHIETAHIGVPAGMQDYIAAYYGGLSIIDFHCGGFVRSTLSRAVFAPESLCGDLVVSFTGQGRFSGTNNWDVVKAYIDDRMGVREKLTAIRDTARSMSIALQNGDSAAIPRLLDEEWSVRRTLAPGVRTPRIERIMAAARAAGATASKICGAGGGGCMISLAPSSARSAVEEAITAAGGTVMPVKINTAGVRVRCEVP